jgi:hypothetical protein
MRPARSSILPHCNTSKEQRLRTIFRPLPNGRREARSVILILGLLKGSI